MLAIFFVLGLIIGSFLNVIICRLDLAESIVHGRSHCPKCKAEIRWYDNVPVLSFVMLRAKCRECMEKISWQYPFIEILTGIVFLLVGNYFFDINSAASWVNTIFYLIIFSLMVVIVGYDIKFMEIPMMIFWVSLITLIVLKLIMDWENLEILSNENFWSFSTSSGFLGGIIAAVFFY
jgi:leader peptidase (prepilin peptidase)/N-methyltransferase